MFKRILVPTDGSESAALGVRYAVALAQKYAAKLLGIYVVDVKLLEGPFLRDLSASLGTAPYVNYQDNVSVILDERGKTALTQFESVCDQAGVACDTTLVTGIVPRAIVENSGLADLIVMGRGGEHNQWLEGLVGSTTEAVIRRASLPVLVTGTGLPGSRRFLVAYDGSRHARQALKTAVGISRDWNMSFHLLVVGPVEAEETMAEARRYVQAHDVQAEYVRRAGEAGEMIVRYIKECQADLLVMGAYGHSKVRELVVGSTTTYALHRASCPVLLSR